MYITIRLRKAAVWAVLLCLIGGIAAAIGLGAAGLPADGKPETSASNEGIALPIIMYHGLLKETKRQGQFVISPDQFEKDLQYLKAHGYTTVVMQDVIDYVRKGTPLPDKPILLSFDDGYYNNYLYAFPLLKQYQMKIVLAPIGRYTEQYSQSGERHANYTHVTWDDLKEMMDSGLVEVQNHTYDMHSTKPPRKGSMRVSGENIEQYRTALTGDVMRMQDAVQTHIGWTPTTFVYPFGAVSKEALPILKELGFQATLVCESRINTLTRDPACLYGLGRFLRPSGRDSDAYFTKTVKLSA